MQDTWYVSSKWVTTHRLITIVLENDTKNLLAPWPFPDTHRDGEYILEPGTGICRALWGKQFSLNSTFRVSNNCTRWQVSIMSLILCARDTNHVLSAFAIYKEKGQVETEESPATPRECSRTSFIPKLHKPRECSCLWYFLLLCISIKNKIPCVWVSWIQGLLRKMSLI